jgi:hypothetical protein
MADAYEEALNAAGDTAPGSPDDQAQAALSAEEIRAAKEKARGLAFDMALTNADRLRKDEDPKVLVDQIEAIFRQLHEAGVPVDLIGTVIDRLKTVTGKTKKILDETSRRIGEAVEATRRNRAQAEAAQAAVRAQTASAADAELIGIAADYPAARGHAYARHGGLIWLGKWRSDDSGFEPICSPFTIEGLTRLPDGSEGLMIAVRNSDDERRILFGRFEDIGSAINCGILISKMVGIGLRLENTKCREKIASILISAQPTERINVINRPGFHTTKGQSFYMTLDGEPVGLPAGLKARLDPDVALPPSMVRGGTFQGWRDMIDRLATLRDAPHWRLSVLAGFAGCLVDYLNLDSCAMNFQGNTSIGKTTAQRIAASAWAMPKVASDSDEKNGFINDGAITAARFEAVAKRSTGTLCVVDDLAKAKPEVVKELAIGFTSGVGKGRMKADMSERKTFAWRALLITSSELTIQEIIMRDKQLAFTAGMAVRLLNIDFDDIVGQQLEAEFKAIEAGLAEHYGHAGSKFAAAVLENEHQGTVTRRKLLDALAIYAHALGPSDVNPMEMRTREVFALMHLAGEMAVVFNIIPASIDVASTIALAYRTFISKNRDIFDPTDRQIEVLRWWIQSNWNYTVIRCDADASERHRPAEAYYDDDAIYIPRGKLSQYAGDLDDKPQRLARKLLDKQMLVWRTLEKEKASDTATGPRKVVRLYTRRVPHHHGLEAYALRRDLFGPKAGSKAAGAAELLKKTLRGMRRDEAGNRYRMGDAAYEAGVADFEKRIAEAEAQVADEDDSGEL